MIVNLKEHIKELQQESDMPEELAAKIDQANQELEESGTVNGLSQGEEAPDFTLFNAVENEITLSQELENGPVVVVFYRGAWCPYCNLQLNAYQQMLPEIHDLGAELIAISPQAPTDTLSLQEKEDLSFQLLSDLKGEVAADYNVLFEVPTVIKEIYQELGLDIAEYNAVDEWILPVPAVFVIDEQGMIRFADANADYTTRTEPQEIVDALEQL